MLTPTFRLTVNSVFLLGLMGLFSGFSPACLGQVSSSISDSTEAVECLNAAYRLTYKNPNLASSYYEDLIPFFKKSQYWSYSCYALTALSTAQNSMGNYELGESLSLEASKIALAHLGKNHGAYIYATNNLAQNYRSKGKLKEAIRLYNELESNALSLPEKKLESISLLYFQMAGIYMDLGDFAKACKYYEKSFQIWTEEGMPSSYRHAYSLPLSLAAAYRQADKFEEATKIYMDFLTTGDSLNFIRICYGLADNYLNSNQLRLAKKYANLGRNTTFNGKKYYEQQGEQLLGRILLLEGDSLNATTHFEYAQKIRLSRTNQRSYIIPIMENYRKMGEVLTDLGQYEKALDNFQLGLNKTQKGQEEDITWRTNPHADSIANPFYAIKLLRAKSRCLSLLYQKNQNDSLLYIIDATVELAVSLIPQIHGLQETNEGKVSLSQYTRPLVAYGIQANKQLFNLTQDESHFWRAFQYSDIIKSRILKEELQEAHSKTAADLPEEIKLEFEKLELEIGFYTKEIFNFNHEKNHTPNTLIQWKNKLFELERSLEDLTQSVEQKYPTYKNKKVELPSLNKTELQQKLPQGMNLLEYFWGDSTLYTFFISHGSIDLKTTPLDDALTQKIEGITQHLNEPDMSQESLEHFTQSSYALAKLLHIDKSLKKAQSLYIVPDGILSYLPFEILLTKAPESQQDQTTGQAYRKLPYVFQSHSIHYLHAASLINWEGAGSDTYQQALAAFAPNYRGKLALKLNKSSAKAIGDLVGGKLFFDEQASEHSFKSEAGSFKTLHLAVHGTADETLPINAYLDFGQGGNDAEDGRLYAYELHAMTIPADMVSLIACDAGYGKLETGEGVMSLARAFRMAGVNNIMTSLWKADGRAAAPISKAFYAQLKHGKRPSKALQEAKQSFLTEASPDLVHPYYWATYVLTGNDEVVWNNYLHTYRYGLLALGLLLLGAWIWRERNKKIKLT